MTGSGSALPGAPGSPLAERSNLIDASAPSAAEGATKKRRPNALLSPLGANKPELPMMLDGGQSPAGTPTRRRRRDFGAGTELRNSLGSPRTNASLTRQQASAWASSRDLSDLGQGQGVTKRGSLVVTVRTSPESPRTPAPGTDAQVWCTLYGVEGKTCKEGNGQRCPYFTPHAI